MLRVVCDTNLYVSSLLVRNGLPGQALAAWRAHRFTLVISPSILSEIVTTFEYPRIRRKYDITDKNVDDLITLLSQGAFIVPGTADVSDAALDDPDDEMILACAVDGAADIIVSGDRHLLSKGAYHQIPIVTVRRFLELLEANGLPF